MIQSISVSGIATRIFDGISLPFLQPKTRPGEEASWRARATTCPGGGWLLQEEELTQVDGPALEGYWRSNGQFARPPSTVMVGHDCFLRDQLIILCDFFGFWICTSRVVSFRSLQCLKDWEQLHFCMVIRGHSQAGPNGKRPCYAFFDIFCSSSWKKLNGRLLQQVHESQPDCSPELPWGEMFGGWLGRDQKTSQRSRDQRRRFEEAAVAINSTSRQRFGREDGIIYDFKFWWWCLCGWFFFCSFWDSVLLVVPVVCVVVVAVVLVVVVVVAAAALVVVVVHYSVLYHSSQGTTELRDLQGKQQEEQSQGTQEVQQRQGKLRFFRSLSVFDRNCLSLWLST